LPQRDCQTPFSDGMKFHEVNRMRNLKDPTANPGKPPVLVGISVAALACAVLLLMNQPAASQEDCASSNLSDPTRQLITCGEALILEREPGTHVTIFERRGSAPPEAIMLENGAIFIEVLPGSQPTQIRTPHAIAAVRGTTYVVDAGTTSTSVFVIKGAVAVSKPDSASTVTLGPGQGVDVEPKTRLNVKRWSADRVSRLLARFGR
jgi:ferric-dicitrate binding protein FerR (iron transport regulator)